MKHKAKKLQAGQYKYRGYELHNASEYAGYTVWNISPEGEGPCDAANSLSHAKAMVDSWEGA